MVASGIIPARAGFTGRPYRGRRLLRDHPRSRGVYLGRDGPDTGRLRIIPARAGFTHSYRGGGSSPRDHPRSRGVYHFTRSGVTSVLGSSPLARGLLRRRRLPGGDPGIIPARAGFTFLAALGTTPARDHPRSRGVYSSLRTSLGGTPGSSPLARGLPGSWPPSGRLGRIIPARAGFTDHRRRRRRGEQDHPRSRGVYRSVDAAAARRSGSSPLARGLRGSRRWWSPSTRIIPARAGFTHAIGDVKVWGEDHPRSRGVYSARGVVLDGEDGSSPLARGLRTQPRCGAVRVGIIPARAGFTVGGAAPERGAQDHPRSRGVYR